MEPPTAPRVSRTAAAVLCATLLILTTQLSSWSTIDESAAATTQSLRTSTALPPRSPVQHTAAPPTPTAPTRTTHAPESPEGVPRTFVPPHRRPLERWEPVETSEGWPPLIRTDPTPPHAQQRHNRESRAPSSLPLSSIDCLRYREPVHHADTRGPYSLSFFRFYLDAHNCLARNVCVRIGKTEKIWHNVSVWVPQVELATHDWAPGDGPEASSTTRHWSTHWLYHLHESAAAIDIHHAHFAVAPLGGGGESNELEEEEAISKLYTGNGTRVEWQDYGVMGTRSEASSNYGHAVLHTLAVYYEALWERGMEAILDPVPSGDSGNRGARGSQHQGAQQVTFIALDGAPEVPGGAKGRPQCKNGRKTGPIGCGKQRWLPEDPFLRLFDVFDPFGFDYNPSMGENPVVCFRRMVLGPASRHILDMKQLVSSSADKKIMYVRSIFKSHHCVLGRGGRACPFFSPRWEC